MSYWRRPRKKRREFVGDITSDERTRLGVMVKSCFTNTAAKAQEALGTEMVRMWAWDKYGKEALRVSETFPELWERLSKVTRIANRDNSYSPFNLGFEIPQQTTPAVSVFDPEVAAYATEDQREKLQRIAEMREKGHRVETLLTEWVKDSSGGNWETATFWFSDLKAWCPNAKTMKRPRVGGPPSEELHQLVRQALMLKDIQ